jgi:hypothetical protein
MTATPCVIDGRPTQDGYACTGCTSRAAGHLAAIIDLADDARAVARGEVRRGGGGGGGGKPGSRPPLNDGATDAVDAVQNALTTLARDIAETRGLKIGRDGGSSPLRSTQPDERAALVPASTLEPMEAS